MDQDTSNTSIPLNQSWMANEDGETERDFTTSYAVILIALAIIAGNCLVILTVKSFGRRLVADIFIFCLALLDLTHTLTSVLLAIIFKFTLIHKSTRGGRRSVFRVLCQAQAWFTVTIQLQSTFIITLITLERFVAVSRPFFYKTYATTPIVIRTLACLLLVSILFSSAPLVGWDEYVLFPNLALCMFRYNSSYAILIVVIGYTDLALVSYCFLAILVSLKKFMKRQAYFAKRRGAIPGPQLQVAKDNNLSKMTKDGAMAIEQSKRLLKVSALVSFLFFLCWLPLMVAITLAQISNKTTDIVSLIATLLPLTSPLANPLIYFFSWERYKKSYIKIIKRFINCWPYRRSIDRKDLTKVPGPNSAIRNHVRNSGLLGRLDLVQCEGNGEDMCSDNVSTPTPLVTQEQFFDKITANYGCDHLSNKESCGELRRYSYDEPKSPRRYTTIGCTHIESSTSFPEGCDSQKERRHTIGEFSEKTVRPQDWCTESTRKPLYRDRCIIRSDEVIVEKREVFLTEQEDTKKRQTFKAQEGIHELYNGGTLTDLEVRNQKQSRPWYKTRGERKSWKKKADYTIKTAEGPTKRDTSFRRHPKRKAPRKNGGNDDILKVYIRSKNIKEIKNVSQSKKEKDPLKSLATESCPITERIGDYLANVIDNDEEWKDCREWRNSWEDWGNFEKDLESSQRESRHFLKERKVDGNELEDYRIEWRNSRKHSRGKIEDYRKEWENSRKESENSRNEWGNSRKECKHSRKELENSRKELESSQNECKNSRKELEDSQNKWRTSRNKWENSRHEYENSRHELEDSRNELEDSRNEWRNSRTELEDSQSEWEDSRKRWSDSWKERENYRMGATAPKQSRELLQEKTRREDNEGNFIIGNKSPTYKVDSDKKRRGHKNRHRHGKMRIKKRSKHMESIRKSSLGNCNAKCAQDVLNCSQKTKRVAGNQKNQLRETVAESDKKDTLIWTYL